MTKNAYDDLLHPQKRRLMKDCLVATLGRLIEIKHILVNLECTDYHNYNDILLDLNLTPDALRIAVPRQIYSERKSAITEDRKLLVNIYLFRMN
jgi:hypothetical protein